jgi:Protein of unknown function (DUF1538)
MIDWFLAFLIKLLEIGKNILPIAVVIMCFQLFVIRRPVSNPRKTLSGLVLVLLGMAFFLEGLELALFPLGNLMATELTTPEFLHTNPQDKVVRWDNYLWVYIFSASLGFASALAEPALVAVALKVEQISGGAIHAWGLRAAVGVGVACGLALGAFRIITGMELYYFIVAGYAIVMIQTRFVPKVIIGPAYDSGVVTTTMVTVPLVSALGAGLAQNIPGRNPLVDGFGLIAFASLFPIITVLGYAQLAHWLAVRNLSSKL